MDVHTYVQTDERMNRRTKYSTVHRPSGATALLTIGKSKKKEKQGKGTADHILTLIDYLHSFVAKPYGLMGVNALEVRGCQRLLESHGLYSALML